MEYPLVKALINLDAIRKNIRNLKRLINKSCKFMAVVKADAYGHGAVKVAQKALQSGADLLGVARIEEAYELRKAGIGAPILVFGYIHPSNAAMMADLDFTASLYDYAMAEALSREAGFLNKPVKVHLKIDTGMGRVGMIIKKPCKDMPTRGPAGNAAQSQVVKEIEKISRLPGIDIKGIYTHFASADSKDRSYTNQQIDMFTSLLDDLKKAGLEFETCHAANSAAIIEFPGSHFDMVRAGISIYGLYPSFEVDKSKVKLFPAMTLKSIVTGVRKVPRGFCVSYGMTFETQKETCLASVPVGYADGFSRHFSSNAHMLVKGCKAPVAGRVCMDQTMIDVGEIKGVIAGDEVVLIGSQGKEIISADELAIKAGTINYEIVSALTSRVKRIYSDEESFSGSG
ncbi:MAG: alanine racemase [Deltaproteobacteria bacterium]|nr:alanine racemase [Deltaproteobacteria bacterium]